MKKLPAFLMALLSVFSLSSCTKDDVTNVPDNGATTAADPTGIQILDGDGSVFYSNSLEVWSEKYPNLNICPFTIHYNEYDTGEYEEQYFYAEGGNLLDWAGTPFSLCSWYAYDDMIVSADGKYAVKNPAPLAEGCTYEAVKLNEATPMPDDITGTVQILDYSNDFRLDGIFIEGDRLSYNKKEKIPAFRNLNKDFCMNEEIMVYISGEYYENAENKAKLFCVPHIKSEEYYQLSVADLAKNEAFENARSSAYEIDALNTDMKTPVVKDAVRPSRFKPGLYDIVLTSGDTICCYVTINIAKEPRK